MDAGRAPSRTDHEILALAVPAFGALVAEPLFLLADSAIVGRLGTQALAGLGIAGAALSGVVGLFVFLAYGTTAVVARRLGAGDREGALSQGVDGMWLAAGLGTLVALTGWGLARTVVHAFGPPAGVAEQAVTYLRWSMPGIPAMLLVLAATGVLRGLQDTRTPLAVAAGGAAANAGLNLVLVYGTHPFGGRWQGMGIAGSGLGTALTQVGMAVALCAVVVRGARGLGVPLRPDRAGIRASGRAGVPLLVRTLSLRVALLLTTWVAASPRCLGAGGEPGGHERVDLSGARPGRPRHRGAGADRARPWAPGTSSLSGPRPARMLRWGVGAGVVFAVLLGAGRGLLAPLFTADPQVQAALVAALLVAAVAQPLAGYVFVLDGVLIGAGDGRYLALAGALQVLIYAPCALAVARYAPAGTVGLVWLWVSFAGVYMLTRAVFLGVRERGDAWLVTGATR